MVERFGVDILAFFNPGNPLGNVIHIGEATNGSGLSRSPMFPELLYPLATHP